MDTLTYSWDIKKGSTSIEIFCGGRKVMSIYLGEAIEIAGREAVEKIIKEIDDSPWIRNWHIPEEIV